MSGTRGGQIVAVQPESLGAEIGIEPGDILHAINGHTLRDQIDYLFYGADEFIELIVERDGRRHRLEIERDYDEDLGLTFREPVFDGMRLCRNHCPFCFLQQMPGGMRRTLYVHDDDYRYSFLLGNFVTLTNLHEDDWQRIGEQHLSPLYVSVHATDLATRRRLLGNPQAPDIVAQIERLGALGVRVHAQIVLAPGMNDGPVLRESIDTLMTLWPTVQTLAIVPVGLTRFPHGGLRLANRKEARAALQLAESYWPRLRAERGITWLYPSDELYLTADRPIPASAVYDDPAQLENGVGLVRSLLDDWEAARDDLDDWPWRGRRLTWVCGTAIAPTLTEIAAQLADLSSTAIDVHPVVNRFFGEQVTVSGLLTGSDVIAALEGNPLDQIVLPRAMFDADGAVTLDDLTVAEVSHALGAPVCVAGDISEVIWPQ